MSSITFEVDSIKENKKWVKENYLLIAEW
jgi:hypothetical protein